MKRVWWVVACAACALLGCGSEDAELADLSVVGYDGLTPIHRATMSGDLAEIERLLSVRHADPNMRDLAGVMPLHYAARAGSLDVVKLLISYGATPTLRTSTGWSALDLALRENHFDVVHFLSQYGFNPGGTTPDGESYLVLALRTRNLELAKFLLQWQADPNIRMRTGGRSLLEEAFVLRDREMVDLLLDHGALITQTSRGTNSPLHVAIEWRDYGLVNRLLSAGADPAVLDAESRTARQHAAELGLEDIVQSLVNAEGGAGEAL